MSEKTFPVRLATEADIEEIRSFDAIAQQGDSRRAFIRRSIAAKECYAAGDKQILGYAVLDYSFFENGFIALLYIHPDSRRQGVGTALVRHLESLCRTEKLFTSTNRSNLPMQSLMAKLGYRLCGEVRELEEGDPEMFYVKRLR
jgi:GNAT superfamily N-acetyltransferase